MSVKLPLPTSLENLKVEHSVATLVFPEFQSPFSRQSREFRWVKEVANDNWPNYPSTARLGVDQGSPREDGRSDRVVRW